MNVSRRLLLVRLAVGERLATTVCRRIPLDLLLLAGHIQIAWWRLTGRTDYLRATASTPAPAASWRDQP